MASAESTIATLQASSRKEEEVRAKETKNLNTAGSKKEVPRASDCENEEELSSVSGEDQKKGSNIDPEHEWRVNIGQRRN